MDSPLEEGKKPQTGSRYPFGSMLVFAVSLVLGLLSGQSNQLLETYRLRPDNLTLESFLTSHLLYANGYHLSVTLILLLITGGILETRWGTPRFAFFYAFTAGGTATVTLVIASALGELAPSCGASGVVLGSFAAIGLLYPDHKLIRYMPAAKYLAWMLIFLGSAGLALLDWTGPGPVLSKRAFLLPQVSGVAFAIIFLRLDPWFQRLAERWKAKREVERREKVVAIRHRVDQLLEKIHSQGYDSLTRDEKIFLRQASKHYKT